MPIEIEKPGRFYQEIKRCCKKDEYNMLLYKHLGDVFYMVAIHEIFEAEYKKGLHYIVRPAHEFFMEMFGVRDYSIYDMGKFEEAVLAEEYKYMFGARHRSHAFDMMCKDLFPSVPQLGQPFVADSERCQFTLWDHYWSKLWAYNAGLNPDILFFPIPRVTVKLQDDIREKIEKEVSGKINRIVLLAPESETATELPIDVWDALAGKIHEKGYKIIVNSRRYKLTHGISAFDLGLSLRDVVALGQCCAYVFAMRTGLCDALVGIGRRLYAIYPAMLKREYGSLVNVFKEPTRVNEILLYRWRVNSVEWEGEDISMIFRKWTEKHRRYCCVGRRQYGTYIRTVVDQANIFPDNNKENSLTGGRDTLDE